MQDVFKELLSANNIGALVSSEVNRRCFTGFASTDGYLAVCRDEAAFFTDSRFTEAAEKKITGCPVRLLTDFSKQLPEFFASHGVTEVLTESERLTVCEYNKLCTDFSGTEVLSDGRLDAFINEKRIIKSQDEIEKIRRAQGIAEKAFDYICGYIKEGMTEKQVQLELDYCMLRSGAEALSFETIAVSGANTSLPHGVPSEKRIAGGDFITLDFGAVYDGLHSDMTRTVILGEPSDEQRRIYATVLAAQNRSLAALKAGVTCFDADKAARDVIADAGYGEFFGHGTGHGVGYEIHENPSLSPRGKDTLRAGYVVTVEPGIYLPGKFGVRIEDMALITDDGALNLTACPKELTVVG